MRIVTADHLVTLQKQQKDNSITAQCAISCEDGFYHDNPLDRYMERGQTEGMNDTSSRSHRRPAVFLLTIALMMASCAHGKSYAQGDPTQAKATLVFFADQGMRDAEWRALFDALDRAMRKDAAEDPAFAEGVEFLRGDKLASGVEMSQPISVYLHGDCWLTPVLRTSVSGPLGWVRRVHGRIEPFIHVDCTKIALELGPLSLGMDRARRDTVMGEAMARVILHEWVHVSTQSARHTRDGVEKATFDAADLLADDEEAWREPGILKRRWKDL
jgi:hypothetical protein